MSLDAAITLLERIHESVRVRERVDKKVIFSGVDHIDMEQAIEALKEARRHQSDLAQRRRFELYCRIVARPEQPEYRSAWQEAESALKAFEQYERGDFP